MADTHRKSCSTALSGREMHIELMRQCHRRPTVQLNWKTVTNKCSQGCGAPGSLLPSGGLENGAAILEQSMAAISYRIELVHMGWLSACTLGCLSQRSENWVHTKPCTWMFLAALFTITPNWKQPKYPSKSEWLNPKTHPSHGLLLSK